ncbi:MAG: hypothetical protein V4670_04455 [Bacteroidota bacterium]
MEFTISLIFTFSGIIIGLIYLIIGLTYKKIKHIGIALVVFYLSFVAFLLPYKTLLNIPIHECMLEIIKGLFL